MYACGLFWPDWEMTEWPAVGGELEASTAAELALRLSAAANRAARVRAGLYVENHGKLEPGKPCYNVSRDMPGSCKSLVYTQ